MKILNSVLILLWAIYTLYKFPHLKPSEDYILFILAVVSMLFSVVNILELYLKKRG